MVKAEGKTDLQVTREDTDANHGGASHGGDAETAVGTASYRVAGASSAFDSQSSAAAEPVLATIYYERKMQAERIDVHVPRPISYIFLYSKAWINSVDCF